MLTIEYLEQSAKELIEKFKLSSSISSWETKLLKDLIALRDAEILSKIHTDGKEKEEQDTLPPIEDPITLTDNSLDEKD